MRTITLPWETWHAVIAVLRKEGPAYMSGHADLLATQLAQHVPNQFNATLCLPDVLYHHSFLWAYTELGIRLPDETCDPYPIEQSCPPHRTPPHVHPGWRRSA